VFLSKSENASRKLPLSWELVEVDFGSGTELVGVNTGHPNRLVEEAIAAGGVADLCGYDRLRREVKYGKSSRVDLLLEHEGRPSCFVEVKNVHMMREKGRAEFPDSVTARGAKHLDELAAEVRNGARAVMVFLVQIGSAERVSLARDIDPVYGAAFDRARDAGVEAIALACRITPEGIEVARPVPILG
jgi:sugar fermentation stimulation protein A